MSKGHISQSELKQLFDYDDKTGNLIWKKQQRGGKVVVGGPAGTYVINKNGYRRKIIHLQGKTYRLHRLIWLWHYGSIPEMIDHIDNDAWNNKIENLRECNRSQNNSNRKFGGNKSGFKGVSKVIKGDKIYYFAQIKIDGKTKHLGSFKTAEEAHEAYKIAAIKRHNDFYKFD